MKMTIQQMRANQTDYKRARRELEANGYVYTGAVMSDVPGDPANGVWFRKGEMICRLVDGATTIGNRALFDAERDAYVEFRKMFCGVSA
jgi:hypothetical protein